MLSRAIPIAVAAIVCVVGIALSSTAPAGARSAYECVDDSWAGTLASGGRQALELDYINESQWNASDSYAAVRLDSGGNVTYDVIKSGGYWEYGTSGNVDRRTEIVSESGSSESAYEEQDILNC